MTPLVTLWENRSPAAWMTLWGVSRLEIHDRLGSTNERAKELAREGGAGWAVVLAEAQTQGRGRGGKHWESPPGLGLWISFLLPSGGREADALLPLRTGLACARILEEWAGPGVEIRLKWPNDLLLGGRKVGGILCETAGAGWVVVGLGLNVRQRPEDFPPGLRDTATSLEAGVGRGLSRGDLVGALIPGIRSGLQGAGPRLTHSELEAYTRRDALLGVRVASDLEGSGVALGITPRGSLILEGTGGGLREVSAGSVQRLVR